MTVATAIFGGLTPFLAELFVRLTGWTALPGAMIAAVALAVLPVFLTMPETRPSLAAKGAAAIERAGLAAPSQRD